ncbi:MAG: AAA family ATPase [Pseudomonadota bacterium]
MYRDFFQLQDNPFGVTPDPDYLFTSTNHQEAFDHLLYGVRERKGFIEVIGAPGTGKTMLCRLFLDSMDHGTRTAYVFNTYLSDMELLQAIGDEFGLRPTGRSRKELIDCLNRFLIDVFAEGGNAVLLIDEAQNLSAEAFEQLRMLSNLETTTDKLLQVVLVGQPELHAALVQPELRQLNDRIAVRYRMQALNRDECEYYIRHRLKVAGGRDLPRIEPEAIDAIHEYSGGIPRKINTICDRALLVAFIANSRRLELDHVRQARSELELLDDADHLEGEPPRAEDPSPRRGWFRQLTAGCLLLGVVGAGGWMWSRHLAGQAEQGPVRCVYKIKQPEGGLAQLLGGESVAQAHEHD